MAALSEDAYELDREGALVPSLGGIYTKAWAVDGAELGRYNATRDPVDAGAVELSVGEGTFPLPMV